MADTAKAALKAVVAKLLATSAVTNLVSTRIYSHVPQNTTYPYIYISIQSQPDFTLDKSDLLHKVRVQAFSQDKSPSQSLDIRTAVFATLHKTDLTLDSPYITNYINVSDLLDCFLEDDGKTFQSIIEFDMSVS